MLQDEGLTAIYCRVACADEYAIEAQKAYLCRYAEEHSYENIRIYADNGYIGLNFDRPGFSALEADIQAGKVKKVLIKDLSRLTRDYVAANAWIDRLIASGVALVMADCGQPVKDLFQRYAALR